MRAIFQKRLKLALSGSDSVTASKAQDYIAELAGMEQPPTDFVIDLNLTEITQNDLGHIVPTAVWKFEPLDNRLPLKKSAKLMKQIEDTKKHHDD